jgi:hypothetical protein
LPQEANIIAFLESIWFRLEALSGRF